MKREVLKKISILMVGLFIVPLFTLTVQATYTEIDPPINVEISGTIPQEPTVKTFKLFVPDTTNLTTETYKEVTISDDKTIEEQILPEYTNTFSNFEYFGAYSDANFETPVADLKIKPSSDIYLGFKGVFACGTQGNIYDGTVFNDNELPLFKKVAGNNDYVYYQNSLAKIDGVALQIYDRCFSKTAHSWLTEYNTLNSNTGLYNIIYRPNESLTNRIFFTDQQWRNQSGSRTKVDIFNSSNTIISGFNGYEMKPEAPDVYGVKTWYMELPEGASKVQFLRFNSDNTWGNGKSNAQPITSGSNYYLSESNAWNDNGKQTNTLKVDEAGRLEVRRIFQFKQGSVYEQKNPNIPDLELYESSSLKYKQNPLLKNGVFTYSFPAHYNEFKIIKSPFYSNAINFSDNRYSSNNPCLDKGSNNWTITWVDTTEGISWQPYVAI